MIFITIDALHVSGGPSAHHQELKTAYTASGICRAFSASYCYRDWVGTGMCVHTQTSSNSITIAGLCVHTQTSSNSVTIAGLCVHTQTSSNSVTIAGLCVHTQTSSNSITIAGLRVHTQTSYRDWVGTGLCAHTHTSSNSITIAVRSRKSSTDTRCCVYSFELLMMGGGTAWNV